MQSILTNTTIATAGRAVNILLGLVAIALITRYLGPNNFGSYILLLSFGAIVQLSADQGLYLTMTRDIAQQPHRQQTIISNIISLRFTLLILAFTVGFLITRFIPVLQELTYAFIVIAVGLSLQSLSQLFMGIYQHYQVVWRATIGDIIGRLIQITAIVAIGAKYATVNTMIVAFAVGTFAAFVIHQLLLPHIAWRPAYNAIMWKKIIRRTWPLGAMLLLNAVYFRIDILILSLFRSSTEVGWYGVAYRIIESALFFPAMFGGLLLPRLSEALARKATHQTKQYLLAGFKLLLFVAALSLIVLFVSGQDIIQLVAGTEYLSAAPLLKLLGLALVIMFMGNLFGFTLVAMQRQMFLLKLYLTLAIFNLLANLLFIPLFGALAAAWTTILTEALATCAAGYLVFKTTKLHIPLTYTTKIILIAVTTTLIALLLPHSLPLVFVLAAIVTVYTALAFFSRTLSLKQLVALRGS